MASGRFDKDGNEMVQCLACRDSGRESYFHQLSVHLSSLHKLTVAQYKLQYGAGVETISAYASARCAEAQKRKPVGTHHAPAVAVPVAERIASVMASAPEGAPSPVGTPDPTKVIAFGVAEMPIREDVAPEDVPLIPTVDDKYELDEKRCEEILLGLADRENIMMVGPTGCGKTTLVEMLAALLGQPVQTMNLRGDIRSSAFVGSKGVVVDDETGLNVTRFKPGILVTAMERGHWLLLDEMDAAPAGILLTLQRVLTHRQLILDEDDGRIVEAHPHFRIIATANTFGRGDDSGLYAAGTNVLNEAFLDRFGTTMPMDYPGTGKHGPDLPDDDLELKILMEKTGLNKATARKFITIARLVRTGAGREECYCTFSTRRLLAWGRKTVRLHGDWARAANVVYMSKLGADDRKYVEAIAQRVMGGRA